MLNESIKHSLVCVFACIFGAFAHATDYFVATTGDNTNDGLTEETAFATVDTAISKATAEDTIKVAAGTYETTTEWGPNLVATMVGTGDTRDDVIIKSAGSYRTLRTASTAVISNLTIVGNTDWKADKGGAVEMTGGVIDNCVIKEGTAYAKNNLAGGNVYMDKNAIVQNCDIIGGSATNRGGNVHIISGNLLNCTVKSGKVGGSGGIGGNLFVNGSSVVVSNCVIEGGTVDARGGNVFLLAGTLKDCQIKDGVVVTASDQYHGGGNVFVQAGTLTRCSITGGSITSGNERGGGVLVRSGGSPITIEDCLIAKNVQGGIYAIDKVTEIYNTTIVDNTGYGVYGYSNYPKSFVNNVLFGNKDSNGLKEWKGNRSEDLISGLGTDDSGFSGTTGYVAITEEAFKDYANGDYRPSGNSALIDVGQSDTRTAASLLDLNGNARIVWRVDIGCYECQKTGMYEVAEEETHGQVPLSVTFKRVTTDIPEGATYSFDFGDGTAVETTTADEITHKYETAGVFSVRITASYDESEVVDEIKNLVRAVESQLYVVSGNKSAAYPYNTAENAASTIASAYEDAEDGCEIVVDTGVYTTTAQLEVTKAVTIRSETSNPNDVIVRNTKTATASGQYYRCFQLDNANAKICDLTVENGSVYNSFGGCLRVVSGVVSNCVIRGGIVTTDGTGNAGGGGADLGGSGIISHCWVTNNVVNGTGKESAYAGGGVILTYGATGRLDNTLIAYNTYVTSGSSVVRGSAGVQIGGGNAGAVIENCTIVSNVVQGAIATESAGIWLNAWDVRFRNCVIAGNWQTASNAFSSITLPNETYVYNCTVDVMPTTTSYRSGSTGFTLGDIKSMFKDFEGGDFTPVPGSVLANKGTIPAYAADFDLAGNKRVFGKAIDIGCYEVQRNPGFLLMIR